jgi:hypothetical protein
MRFLPQPCVTMTPTAMYRWANRATVTGSVRADTRGCSAAPPCWCSTADLWGVSCRPLRTARSQPHKRLCRMNWSRRENKTYRTHLRDTSAPSRTPSTCLQELCLFLWETGQGINMTLDLTHFFSCCSFVSVSSEVSYYILVHLNKVCRWWSRNEWGKFIWSLDSNNK